MVCYDSGEDSWHLQISAVESMLVCNWLHMLCEMVSRPPTVEHPPRDEVEEKRML